MVKVDSVSMKQLENGYLVDIHRTTFSPDGQERYDTQSVFCKTLAKVNKLIKATFQPPVDNSNIQPV